MADRQAYSESKMTHSKGRGGERDRLRPGAGREAIPGVNSQEETSAQNTSPWLQSGDRN